MRDVLSWVVTVVAMIIATFLVLPFWMACIIYKTGARTMKHEDEPPYDPTRRGTVRRPSSLLYTASVILLATSAILLFSLLLLR
jgi:hypothetical protein